MDHKTENVGGNRQNQSSRITNRSKASRSSEASSAALGGNSITISLQHAQNHEKSGGTGVIAALQNLISAGVIKIGATGLEPATS